MDYVDYVHKNIFDVLDMKDTSIGANLEDNEKVAKQREKLKCYTIDGEFLGEKVSYINFYPAGSGTGTLSDFYKFASAITPNSKKECPLFKNEETLNKLLTPTSFYGKSEVINNCHGFFATQYKIDTLGHGGNTFGSSAMIQFDPNSKIGMIVFTNQAHEKVYNYDIYELVFGSFKDSEYNKIEREIPQGITINSRGIFKGPFKIFSAISLGGFDESDLNSWWYQDGNYIYGGYSDSYIDFSTTLINLVIFLAFFIGCIYSLITTISFIIHVVKKNQIKDMNKYNYLLNILNSGIFINTGLILLKIAKGTITGDMGSYSSYKFRIVITFILYFALIISTIVFLYKFRNSWKELTKKTKLKYIITFIFIVTTIIAGIYFDMYEFWNL